MTTYFNFQPDVIVEATSVCDRKCAGCYAPNVTTQEDSQTLLKRSPSLFLNVNLLKNTLMQVAANKNLNPVVSIRGGEPTRHPGLSEILSTLSHFTNSVFLETHGRWILKDEPMTNDLLQMCAAAQTVIKVSFDKMHGLPAEMLKEIAQRLSNARVKFVVAITEPTESDLLKSRNICDWLTDNQIIFQKKAVAAHDLIQPSVGVIGVDGKLTAALNTRPSFSISLRQTEKEVAV